MKEITDCDLNNRVFCRLCGQKEETLGYVDVYGDLGEERVLWEKIRNAVQVLILKDDFLPRIVCTSCCDKVDFICNFQNVCQETQARLGKIVQCPEYLLRDTQQKEDNKDVNRCKHYQNSESDLMLHIPSPVLGSSGILDDIDELTCGTLEISTDDINSDGESPDILNNLSLGPVNGNELMWGNQEHSSNNIPNNSSSGQSGDLDQSDNELFISDNMIDVGLTELNEDLDFSMPSSDIMESIFEPFDSVLNDLPQDTNLRPALAEISGVQREEFKGNYKDILPNKLKQHIIRVRVPRNDAVTKEVEKVSEGQYRCKICKRTFRSKYECEYHVREHLGKKQFHCHCGKSYPAMYLLKRHSLVHNDILSFACQHCEKTFRKANSLRSHILTHNPDTRHACNECGKNFSYKQDLAFHVQTHNGNFEHVCNVCGKGFVKRRDLNLHVKHHLGEKPHNCPDCGKSFLKKSNMKRHTFVHLKDK